MNPSTEAIVERLVFRIGAAERSAWSADDATHWDEFLHRQKGFLRKEVLVDDDHPDQTVVLIWWASLRDWQQVPAEERRAVEDAMSSWRQAPGCHQLRVLRTLTGQGAAYGS